MVNHKFLVGQDGHVPNCEKILGHIIAFLSVCLSVCLSEDRLMAVAVSRQVVKQTEHSREYRVHNASPLYEYWLSTEQYCNGILVYDTFY